MVESKELTVQLNISWTSAQLSAYLDELEKKNKQVPTDDECAN